MLPQGLHYLRQMENYLQEEFEMLMEVVSVLPGNAVPPVIPFISLVVNINVITKAHRDSHDRHLCMVIPVWSYLLDTLKGGPCVCWRMDWSWSCAMVIS